MNVTDYLSALKVIYRDHGAESPHTLRLRRKVGAKAIAKVEKVMGTTLHPQLRALWDVANGSDDAPVFHDGKYLCGYALLSVEQALDERDCFKHRAPQYDRAPACTAPRDPRVGVGWFSPGWLPFAAESDHAVLLVDHQPLGSGVPGQIIRYVHDPDRIEYVADSLAELLPRSLAAIQNDPAELLCIF